MIEIRAHFTDHHIGSASELQKIIADSWPVTTVALQQREDVTVMESPHSSSCSNCVEELLHDVE